MDEPAHYEIEVAEALDERWSEWFGGLNLSQGDSGSTSLRGEIADQAALFGVLYRIRDLGLTLISVQRIREESTIPVLVIAESAQGTTRGNSDEGR